MEIKKILFVCFFIYVCVKLEIIHYVRTVWSFYIFWSTLRRILELPIRRIWSRLKAGSCDGFQVDYNEKMHSCKETSELSQMPKDAGQPQLEFDSGTGANFAYHPDGTIPTCLDPTPEFSDELLNNAAMSMF